MKVKRIIIPTLTMIIIASSLMGCAAATQDEAVEMLNRSDQVEIEVAELDEQKSDSLNGLTGLNEVEEQGTEKTVDWIELASLETNPELRSAWDRLFGNTTTDTGKQGAFYINNDGNPTNNSTLSTALFYTVMKDYLNMEGIGDSILQAVADNYTDIDAEDTDKAFYAGINGYFNLLPDYEPNFANMDATLQRNEFMAMLFRADTPVQELTEDTKFTESVGETAYNIYAQGVADNSYLDLESKSLDEMTYTSTITRAEAIYMIISRYYNSDLENTDPSTTEITFKDAKDAGDIATAQNIDTTKDYWKSNILNYAIQNPDSGLPTDLYKALIVAADKEIIDASQATRWDEPLTRFDAIELLFNTYSNAHIDISEALKEQAEEKAEAEKAAAEKKYDITSEEAKQPHGTNEYGGKDYSYGVVKIEDGWMADDNGSDEILNNRTQEEKEKDAEDGYVGVEVRIDEATGQSIGIDLITGVTYHINDTMSNGFIFVGDEKNNVNDYIALYRGQNPDSKATDEELREIWQWAFNK